MVQSPGGIPAGVRRCDEPLAAVGLASGLLNSHSVGSCAGESALAGRLVPAGVVTVPAGDPCARCILIRRRLLFGRACAPFSSAATSVKRRNCQLETPD